MRLLKGSFYLVAFLAAGVNFTYAGTATAQPSTREHYALIYSGMGADADSTQAIADVVKNVGLPIKYVDDINTAPTLLVNARVFIIGGTDDDVESILDEFKPSTRQALTTYLHNGGRFLGMCGGAFLASTGWHDESEFVPGLGFTPAESDAYDEDFSSKIYPVTWLGQKRHMYYQAGPAFALLPDAEATQVVARYENNKPAALINAYGRGKVAVSGPHPEAPSSWKENAKDGDAMQNNVYLAEQLLRDLLSDQSIIHGKP